MDAGRSIAKSAAASLSPVSLLLLLLASGTAAAGVCTSTDLQKQQGNDLRLLMVVFRPLVDAAAGCLHTNRPAKGTSNELRLAMVVFRLLIDCVSALNHLQQRQGYQLIAVSL